MGADPGRHGQGCRKKPDGLTLPKPKITGSPAIAVCLALTLAAALGIAPIKMRFGGADGTLYYVWGRVYADNKWRDVDILLPKCGEHRKFDHYEEIEVPV